MLWQRDAHLQPLLADSAGITLRVPRWKGYTPNQGQAMGPAGGFANQAQFIPNLIFSGVLDRYPRLRWVW